MTGPISPTSGTWRLTSIPPSSRMYIDADGRLGTNPTSAGPESSVLKLPIPKGVRPQGMSDEAKQAMLNRKVEALETTVGQQHKQIQALTSDLRKNRQRRATPQRVGPMADLKRAKSPVDESAVADLPRSWSTIPKTVSGSLAHAHESFHGQIPRLSVATWTPVRRSHRVRTR